MGRLHKFQALENHPWYGSIVSSLTLKEFDICINFVLLNDQKTPNDYQSTIDRMFLDKEKPKHWKEIMDLLSASNR